MTDINEFRDGIFALRTRRFGNIAEIMIKKLYKFSDSGKLEYDKFDAKNNQKIEIKFSTTMKKNDKKINEENAIQQCCQANFANRILKSTEVNKFKFDCNIQQIKCCEFDVLYYGLFFADKIFIFRMTSEQVLDCSGYSNKQHRNNEGEGQFHINNDTFEYHMKNFFERELTYEELYKLFQ